MSMFDGIDGVTSEYDWGDLDSKVNELENLVGYANDYDSIFKVFECLAVIAAKHDEELRYKPTYITSLAVFGYNVINSYYYGQDGDVIWDKLNKFKDRAYECSSWSEHERHKWMLGELTYRVGCMADESSFTLFCDELQRCANIRSKLPNDVILTGKLSDEYNNPLPQYDEDYESKLKQIEVESEKKDDYSKSDDVMVKAASKTNVNTSNMSPSEYSKFEYDRLNISKITDHEDISPFWNEAGALRWYHYYPLLDNISVSVHIIGRGILKEEDLLVEFLKLFKTMSKVYSLGMLQEPDCKDILDSSYLFKQVSEIVTSIDFKLPSYKESLVVNKINEQSINIIINELIESDYEPITTASAEWEPIGPTINVIRRLFIRNEYYKEFIKLLKSKAGVIEVEEVNKSVDETMSSIDKFLEDFFK